MPESVKDRPTKAHEYVLLLSKAPVYYFDGEAVKGPALPESEARYGGKRYINTKYADESVWRQPIMKARLSKSHHGRNIRTIWNIPKQPFGGAHFATFPEKLVKPCVLAGCPEDRIVLDPFCGSGTVGVVCARYGRKFIGMDLKWEYLQIAKARNENKRVDRDS